MNSRYSFLLAAALGLTVAAASAADNPAPSGDISVYLSPDAAKPALLHASAGDARLADAKPVADTAKAAEGWQVVSLSGPFVGYVTSKAGHKDFSIDPGTPVHVSADENSPVLGLAAQKPLLSISSPGVDWSEVSFPGPVTAYFQASALKAASVAATPAAAIPPVSTISAPPTRPATATPVTALTPVTAAPTAKQADPNDVAHYYYGVLKARTDLKINGPTNAQYVLYSNQGQLLALVDLADVVLPNPVIAYLDKSVKIYGTAYPEAHMPSVVIHALTLQAN